MTMIEVQGKILTKIIAGLGVAANAIVVNSIDFHLDDRLKFLRIALVAVAIIQIKLLNDRIALIEHLRLFAIMARGRLQELDA